MARRYDQYYRVKPRDNLGDPDYWNRRFEDIDRRVSSNEDDLTAIDGLTAYVEGLALNRLDLVLAPALDKITLVSEQGFLLAHSSTSVTLDTNTTQTFAIQDQAERELFAPSPYLTITREANMTDYCFAKLVSYDKRSGQLVIQPVEIHGNAGPFSDWVIYVGTAISQAVVDILAQVQAARTTTLGYRDAAAGSAAAAAADKTTVAGYRTDALAARDAAQLAYQNSQTWDPTNYYLKTEVDTRIAGLVNSAPTTLDTLSEIAAALGNDANFSATITAALGFRLRVDNATQGLTTTQQLNGRTNLGLGNLSVLDRASVADLRTNNGTKGVTSDIMWSASGFVDLGNSGSGSLNVDCTLGSRFRVVLTGNVVVNLLNPRDGQVVDLICIQDGVGGRTVSWNGNIRFPDSQAPTVYTAANNWAVIFSGVYNSNYGQWLAAGWKVN